MITVGLIAVPPMQLMSLEAITVLQTANSLAERPTYRVELVSEAGGLVETSAGFSDLLTLQPKTDRIESVLAFAKKNLKAPLTVAQLAEVARLSPRQFSRAFNAATGQSPAKVIERLRVEAAHAMIIASRHSLETIAAETGFDDRERMRRAFVRVHGRPPQDLRRTSRELAAA